MNRLDMLTSFDRSLRLSEAQSLVNRIRFCFRFVSAIRLHSWRTKFKYIYILISLKTLKINPKNI